MRSHLFVRHILCLVLCLSAILLWYVALPSRPTSQLESKNKSDCVTKTEKREVRGNSLSPVIQEGQHIQLLQGYYLCHSVERGDIIAYRYGGNATPVIKIVKGVGGDRFELKKTQAGCWNLLINDALATNSEGEPYCFDDKRHNMLSLYERDYHGVIPLHSYLILGNLAQGTTDSTLFGLIDVSDVMGKIIRIWE